MSYKQRNNQFNPPDLSDILENLKADIFKNLNCINIGYIESFDTTDQTATIRMAIRQVRDVNLDGSEVLEEKPLLLKCPVFILTGGSSHITMPIAKGDICLVLFNDRDIDNFFFDGGVRKPNSERMHDLSDAFAIIGIRNILNSIGSYLANGIQILLNSATKIELIDGVITIKTQSSEIVLSDALINSTVALLQQNGNMIITGGLQIGGSMTSLTASPISISSSINHTGDLVNIGSISAGNGASGTFDSKDGKTITVVNGIVTSIS